MYLSFICLYPMGGSREGVGSRERFQRGGGSGPPLKNHKNIGFLSNTDPHPLENHKATKHHLNGFRWRANDDPLIVVFESSLPHQLKTNNSKKKVVKVGPPLTKLPGSAHLPCTSYL